MLDAGIHLDIPTSDYFADPCATPSLTQSIAKLLIERSPRHAWVAHPRLNPQFERDDPTKYDIGNIAHRLMLGRGKTLAVLDYADWRKDAAKLARAEAADKGLLAVLAKDVARAAEMVKRARQQLEAYGIVNEFEPKNGAGEVVIAWQEGALWFRSMIDWLTTDRQVVIDYKTTGASAAPHRLPNKMVDDGWDIQAAFHARGLDALDPDNAGRRQHLFICQEDEEPFALTVAEMSEAALTMGRKKIKSAVSMWERCCALNDWPCYPAEIVVPEYPGFKETQWLDREYAEEVRAQKQQPMLTSIAGG